MRCSPRTAGPRRNRHRGLRLLFVGIDMPSTAWAPLASHISRTICPAADSPDAPCSWASGCSRPSSCSPPAPSMTTTLAAVATGAIGLDQAAAIVVGQNLGNTPTPMLASIGAPAAAKRTALAHMLFNTITAFAAFLALPLLLGAARTGASLLGADDAPTILAVFHTVFNVLGVALLLPRVGPFSRPIERIIPEPGRLPPATSPRPSEVGPVGPSRVTSRLVLATPRQAEPCSRGSSRPPPSPSHTPPSSRSEVRPQTRTMPSTHRTALPERPLPRLRPPRQTHRGPPHAAGQRPRTSIHEPVEAAAKLLSEALDMAGTIPEPQTGAHRPAWDDRNRRRPRGPPSRSPPPQRREQPRSRGRADRPAPRSPASMGSCSRHRGLPPWRAATTEQPQPMIRTHPPTRRPPSPIAITRRAFAARAAPPPPGPLREPRRARSTNET